MEQREIMEQVGKLHSENPAKFIKIRDIIDDIFGGRELSGANAISDREFDRLRGRFQEIDVPFSWCSTKESVYQLQKTVRNYRARDKREDYSTVKKSAKSKKKGLLGLFK